MQALNELGKFGLKPHFICLYLGRVMDVLCEVYTAFPSETWKAPGEGM